MKHKQIQDNGGIEFALVYTLKNEFNYIQRRFLMASPLLQLTILTYIGTIASTLVTHIRVYMR